MIRHTAAVALMLMFSGIAAAAADGISDDAATVTGSKAAAFPALAADAEWGRPAIHVPDAPRGGVLPSLYVTLAGLHAYDGYSTVSGVHRGAAETNPVVKSVAGNPMAMIAVKGGVIAASIFMAERLWKQNRRSAAIATMIVTNGLMAAVAARNASVLRTQR